MTDTLDRAADRVPAICDRIDADVSAALRERATAMADRADTEYPINRAPSVAAASAIYLAGLVENETLTQQQVAAAADVNVASIRAAYRELFEHEGLGEGVDLRRSAEDDEPEREPGGRWGSYPRGALSFAIALAAVVAVVDRVFGRLAAESAGQIAENAPMTLDLWPAWLAVVALAAIVVLTLPYLPRMGWIGGRR